MRKLAFVIASTAVAAFNCWGRLYAEDVATQVQIGRCEVIVWGVGSLDSLSSDMRLHFVNESPDAMSSIVFRAQTPAGTIDFTMPGTFSPGVGIDRYVFNKGSQFRSTPFTMTYPAFDVMGPGVCTVIQTVSKSGSIWRDPNAGPAAIDVPPVPQDPTFTVPRSFDNPTHDPIGIVSCQFTEFTRFGLAAGRAYGYVRFRNLSSKPIDAIVFRAFYGPAGMDFVNRGTFVPNVDIRVANMERRDLPPNIFPGYETLDAPTSCTAVSAHYADGTSWQNPSVGPTEPPFPAPKDTP